MSKKRLKDKVVVVLLAAIAVLFLILFLVLILYKKHSTVSYPIPIGLATKGEQETQKLAGENSNVLGSKSTGQIVFYDSNGVKLGTSLNENLNPQIDITVDDKTTSKSLPPFANTTKTLGVMGYFFVNGWTKLIEFISVVLDKIIS